jgi:hypothetical protein
MYYKEILLFWFVPDPAFILRRSRIRIKVMLIHLLPTDPPRLQGEPSWLEGEPARFTREPPQLPAFHFDADPYPVTAFDIDADPDTASQNDV